MTVLQVTPATLRIVRVDDSPIEHLVVRPPPAWILARWPRGVLPCGLVIDGEKLRIGGLPLGLYCQGCLAKAGQGVVVP